MTGLSFHFDVKNGGIAVETLLDEKQARYAMMLAINRTAEAVNWELQRQIRAGMIVRQPRFLFPPVPLPRALRATVQHLRAIAGPSDTQADDSPIRRHRARILSPFETGGVKRAQNEMRPVPVPTDALRPDRRQQVPRSMYPSALRLQPRRYVFAATKKRAGYIGILQPTSRRIRGLTPTSFRTQLVGKRRTFVLDPKTFPGLKPSAWGVYRRIGPKPRDIEMIWSYRKQVRIPDLLDWFAAADRIVPAEFWRQWQRSYELAMRTAR